MMHSAAKKCLCNGNMMTLLQKLHYYSLGELIVSIVNITTTHHVCKRVTEANSPKSQRDLLSKSEGFHSLDTERTEVFPSLDADQGE